MVMIRDAKVVDFPEPVAPVTSTRPLFSLVSSTTDWGRFSCSAISRLLMAHGSLAEYIDAETAFSCKRIGKIHLALLVEAFLREGIGLKQHGGQGLRLCRCHLMII